MSRHVQLLMPDCWLLKARQRKPASPEFKKIAQRFGNGEVRVSRSSSLHERVEMDAHG